MSSFRAPFSAYEYFAPNAQKADPGAPGAVQHSPAAEQSRARRSRTLEAALDVQDSTALGTSAGDGPWVAQASRSTDRGESPASPRTPRSLFGWVGLLGLATYGFGLGVALDAWLR